MSMVASKLDPVSYNRVWEEHVKKENHELTLGTNFAISDPRKMHVLPEKPNRTVPTKNPSEEMIKDSVEQLTTMSALKDTHKVPHERFALPLTANMEYGFFSSKHLVKPNQMFDYKTHSCDVTAYANTYATNAGTSPYARKE